MTGQVLACTLAGTGMTVTAVASPVRASSQRDGVDQNNCAERLAAAARQCFLNTAASASSVSAGGCQIPRLLFALVMMGRSTAKGLSSLKRCCRRATPHFKRHPARASLKTR